MKILFPLLMIATLTTGCAGMDEMTADTMMSTDKKMDSMSDDSMKATHEDKMKMNNPMDKTKMPEDSM